MIKNYLRIAYRNIFRQKFYSGINILGLSIGLATCLLILIYLNYQLGYDKFHSKGESIFRAHLTFDFNGSQYKVASSPTALLPTLQRNFPAVESGVRILNSSAFSPKVVNINDQLFQENRFYFADSTFFQVFDFEVIQGNPRTALSEPQSVVITESTARKYFGNINVVGELLTINDLGDYKITDIVRDVPAQSHFHFDLVASFVSLKAAKQEIWHSANYGTYILLKDQASADKLEQELPKVLANMLGEEAAAQLPEFALFPLTDIHLHSDVMHEWEPQSSIDYIYLFAAVAFLVLLIACVNYVNMATARSMERAKEVGIRKVIGAFRFQLIRQFLSESMLLSLLAILGAWLIVLMVLPLFNTLTEQQFTFSGLLTYENLVLSIGFWILVGILAGIYPAFVLSYFQPVKVLKGRFKTSGRGKWLKHSLVVAQFAITVILIISSLIIRQQLDYFQNKKLGYNRENVLVIPAGGTMIKNRESLKSHFGQLSEVSAVTFSTESVVEVQGGYSISLEGMEEGESLMVTAFTGDEDVTKVLGLELIAGTNFTPADMKSVAGDDPEHRFLINETLANKLTTNAQELIGKRASLNGRNGLIKGILSDFHFNSLRHKIEPLVIFNTTSEFNDLFIKLTPGNVNEQLSTLESAWSAVVPDRPFNFQFLDQQYDAMYKSEMNLGQIFSYFTLIATFVACLGLFALISYTTSQQAKDISIYKIFGAEIHQVVFLLIKNLVFLVVLAGIIAIPVGYFGLNQWLQSYAYHVEIGWFPIFVSLFLSVVLAILTTGSMAIKAAYANPADALRNE